MLSNNENKRKIAVILSLVLALSNMSSLAFAESDNPADASSASVSVADTAPAAPNAADSADTSSSDNSSDSSASSSDASNTGGSDAGSDSSDSTDSNESSDSSITNDTGSFDTDVVDTESSSDADSDSISDGSVTNDSAESEETAADSNSEGLTQPTLDVFSDLIIKAPVISINTSTDVDLGDKPEVTPEPTKDPNATPEPTKDPNATATPEPTPDVNLDAASGSCGTNLTYAVDSHTVLDYFGKQSQHWVRILTLDGSGAMKDYTAYGMPWKSYLMGSVSGYGNIAFAVIPEGVTHIGSYAFCGGTSGNNLQGTYTSTDDLPEYINCTTTGYGSGSSSFNERYRAWVEKTFTVNLPDSVTSIGSYAFARTGVWRVLISNNVTEIGENAFASGATVIVDNYEDSIPGAPWGAKQVIWLRSSEDSVLAHSNLQVDDNGVLTHIEDWSDLVDMGDGTFISTQTNVSYRAVDSIPETALTSDGTEVTITEIGADCFNGCTTLNSTINIPDGVKAIDASAFTNSSATTINIPNVVSTIASTAFNGSVKLNVDNFKGAISGEKWGTSGTVTYLRDMSIADIPAQSYTGSAVKPALTVKLYNTSTGETIATLNEGTDYTVTYSNNVDVGTATATVTYIGSYANYTGSNKSKTFTISTSELTAADVTISSITSQTYTGSAITPSPTIKLKNGTTLVKGTDYTLSYANNINVGTATITVNFTGAYTGTVSTTFSIVSKALSSSQVTISSIADRTYTGSYITPSLTVKITAANLYLSQGTDYTLSYADNKDVGTAKITINFIGNYSGNASTTFDINPVNANNAILSGLGSYMYTGAAITPVPTVKLGSKTLTKDTDYTLSYAGNINAGSATVTATFMGNYSGTASTTFQITSASYSVSYDGNVEYLPSGVDFDWDKFTLYCSDGTQFVGTDIGDVWIEDEEDIHAAGSYITVYCSKFSTAAQAHGLTTNGNDIELIRLQVQPRIVTQETLKDIINAHMDVADSDGNIVNLITDTTGYYYRIPAQTYNNQSHIFYVDGDMYWSGKDVNGNDVEFYVDSDYHTETLEDNTKIGTGYMTVSFSGNYTGEIVIPFDISMGENPNGKLNLTTEEAASMNLWLDNLGQLHRYADWDEMKYCTDGTCIDEDSGHVYYICTVIPETIGGEPVYGIADSAFRSWGHGVTEVIIPDSVDSIGQDAFEGLYGSVQSIQLPSDLSTIGSFAFYGNTTVSSYYIPGNSGIDISYDAFLNTNATLYIDNIPGSVNDADDEPWGADKVVWLNDMEIAAIPDQKETLKPLTPALSIKLVSKEDKSTIAELVQGVDYTVQYSNNIRAGVATATVTYIGSYAGYNGAATTATFNITPIPDDGIKLAQMNLQLDENGVLTHIEDWLDGTDNGDGTWTSATGNLYYDCTSIPAGEQQTDGSYRYVTKIGDNCFEGWDSKATNLVIPDTVTEIGIEAFNSLSGSFDIVAIPSGCVAIGRDAFGASRISSFYVPDSVKTIGSGAFETIGNAATVTVDNYIGSIVGAPWGAEGGITWLRDMQIADIADQQQVGNETITPALTIKVVDTTSGKVYETLAQDTDFSVRYSNNTAPGTATATVDYTGDYTSYSGNVNTVTFNIVSVENPDGKANLTDEEAALLNLQISEDGVLTHIEEWSGTDNGDGTWTSSASGTRYYKCTYIPETIDDIAVTEIGDKCFYRPLSGIDTFTQITLPSTVTKIGEEAFFRCVALQSIELSDVLTSIGYDAFSYCTSLSEITIPHSIKTISSTAFSYTTTNIIVDNVIGVIANAPWETIGNIAYLRDLSITRVADQKYTGTAVTPTLYITEEGTNGTRYNVLGEGTDFTVNYTNNVDVGTATATVTYTGDYAGYAGNAKSITFDIVSADMNDMDITITNGESYVYTGSAIEPVVTVTDNGTQLRLGTDYTVSYSDNINAGTAAITVTGIGSYNGTATAAFTIAPKSGDLVTIAPITDCTFTGFAIEPDVVITDTDRNQ